MAWIAAVTDLELSVFYLATFLLFLEASRSVIATDGQNDGRNVRLLCGGSAFERTGNDASRHGDDFRAFLSGRPDRNQHRRETIAVRPAVGHGEQLYFVVRTMILGGIASVVSRPNFSWYDTIVSAIALIGGYIGKLIWPSPLSAFYVFHASQHLTDIERSDWIALELSSLCGILFGVLWKTLRICSRLPSVWIFLPLGPVLNARWMPAGVFAERYLYLPSVGFCWLVACGAVALWSVRSSCVHASPCTVRSRFTRNHCGALRRENSSPQSGMAFG